MKEKVEKAVFGIVQYQNKIIATTRPYDDKFAIGLPGGFVDEGETTTEALLRECEEEGLKINNPKLKLVHKAKVDNKKIYWFDIQYDSIKMLDFYKEKDEGISIFKANLEDISKVYGNEFMLEMYKPQKDMVLVSSNKNKIKEFKDILGDSLKIETGKDLDEVNGNMNQVILYKSFDAGKGYIVEDTILKIDGKEVVDIKWNQEDKLKNASQAEWIVSLGYNDGKNIYISRGIIKGTIQQSNDVGFGFDPYFIPNGSDKSLHQLNEEGKKDLFSARKEALLKFKNNDFEIVQDIKKLQPWQGSYQNEQKKEELILQR